MFVFSCVRSDWIRLSLHSEEGGSAFYLFIHELLPGLGLCEPRGRLFDRKAWQRLI